MVSFYWTITTITTVGYGDIVANNFAERVFCACMMIIGVISFSFANGSLTSILSHNDQQKADYIAKLDKLHRMQQEYHLPDDLYQEIKMSLGFEFQNNINKEQTELI